MKEHEEARKKMKETRDEDVTVKDLLDILLDIYEDKNAEKRLTRENIKAFIMVSGLIDANLCKHNIKSK